MTLRPMLIAAALPVAACTAQMDDSQRDIRAPAATVIGAAESCVSTNRIRSTEVQDDYTIDFVMTGGDRYRNTLPNRCNALGFGRSIAYSTSTGRLCDVDIVDVIDSSGTRMGTCALGEFVPVELVED